MALLKDRIGRVATPGVVDYIERDVEPPKPGHVLIRVRASAVCGSDLHIYKGLHPSVALPATIGHEFSGDIAYVGDGVTGLKPGDRVTVEPCVTCGVCPACRRGEYGYCESISFTYRMGDGAMAGYVSVRASQCFLLPEGMSYGAGALIEPLAVAVHAVRRADVRLGMSAVVLGAGAIGILVAAVCKLCGAKDVIIADLSDKRLEMASDFGATRTVNAMREDVLNVVRDMAGDGCDRSFECVGHETTFNQALAALGKNGLATVVGIFERPQISVNTALFVTREIRVQGAQGYCRDFPAALDIAGKIGAERLITHKFALDGLKDALDTCLDPSRGCVKAVIEM